MNINTNFPHVSLNTVNPATVAVRRDNDIRPMIPATNDLKEGAAESPLAGDRDKTLPQGLNVQLGASYELPSAADDTESTVAHERSSDEENAEQGRDGRSERDQEDNDGESSPGRNASGENVRYSEQELKQIAALQKRDAEVVRHELAHATIGGKYAGTPSYSYETGPDGGRYAVSGEVSIDTSKVANDPQGTLRKAQQIKAAALAPSQPSSQDRRVAAEADIMAAKARQELSSESQASSENRDDVTRRRSSLSESSESSEASKLAGSAESRSGDTPSLEGVQPADFRQQDAVVDKQLERQLERQLRFASDPTEQANMQSRGQRISHFYQTTHTSSSPGQIANRI